METPDRQRPDRLEAAFRLIAILGSLCIGLVVAVAYLLLTRGGSLDAALQSDDVRDRAVQHLVAMAGGVWDSFPDPDVGRVLQPNLTGEGDGRHAVATNRYGVREKEYALPKPADLTRVVLLGDSYMFGPGIELHERAGHWLESSLAERAGASDPIEVVQIGMSSWNIVAECSFLRRQLALLEPSLVVQFVVLNDLDDTAAVRGFGVPARFSAHHRERADSLFVTDRRSLGVTHQISPLPLALDHESRSRFDEARSAIHRLAQAVEAAGGRYLLVVNWAHLAPVAREHLAAGLRDDQVTYLPRSFVSDEAHWVGPRDPHWNATGNEIVAELVHGLIESWSLLPRVPLEPWPEAQARVTELHEAGLAEARKSLPPEKRLGKTLSTLDWPGVTAREATQIHGGVDTEGMVSPYAALLMDARQGDGLELFGRVPPRTELTGATVRISVEEFELGAIRLRAGEPFAFSKPLPDAVRDRDYVTVRLESDDFVYMGDDLQTCVSVKLESVSIR